MDGGGYSWENVDPELLGIDGLVAWDDPDFDYLTGETPVHGESLVFFWNPWGFDTKWPLTYKDGEYTYRLLERGVFYERDHECNCHGRYNLDEPLGWEFTGDSSDDPYPKCDRCEGDGYLTGEPGDYAVYVMFSEDDQCGCGQPLYPTDKWIQRRPYARLCAECVSKELRKRVRDTDRTALDLMRRHTDFAL
jgi:hypothetical protein